MTGLHPHALQVELQTVAVAPGSALHPWAQHWQLGRRGGETAGSALPPSALADHAALAFQLKTQASLSAGKRGRQIGRPAGSAATVGRLAATKRLIWQQTKSWHALLPTRCRPPRCARLQAACLWGWDLPALLPDVAALPPLQLLPQLVEDVTAALQHARRKLATAHETLAAANEQGCATAATGAARAVRWALKRCLRAAAELCLLGGSEAARGGTAQFQGRQELQEQQQRMHWSRDLWWCALMAAERHPKLEQPLMASLQQYVDLAAACSMEPHSGSGAKGAAVAALGLQERLAAVEGAAAACAELATQLDGLFLQQMLGEEPGWLTHHQGGSWAGAGTTGSGSGGGRARILTGNTSWWQRLRVRLWAAAAGSGMEPGLLGAAPPPVAAPVAGPVLTLDWRQPEAQRQATAIIAATLAAAGGAAPDKPAEAADPSGLEHSLQPQPVLLKGAAAHWPALRRWSLAHLAASGLQGRARLTPSLQFPFTEPRLAAVLAEQQGGQARLPTVLQGDA